ncbi:AGAP004082-PA-like protein [Anopheles sinensis]|uniref:Protein with SprT-like domain at the N terminus n=1 Tax=Anopheles sinensis TaxID=74873 RepID=A0A084VEQ8_ANOSI|nr:AGAP004082-PA-like protein [Anopheles sinensis]
MGKDDDLNSTQNLVHPEWEILDPTPDIFSLFPLFDRKFFQGRLSCVQLEWSKKMYNCAGICYQRSNRLGKSCIIRLSEPLLKLRPRKDLIQTLLHEMIHAYCFVLGIREGNGGHGPTFKKIMNGINKIAGTNITVYHSFHDEVNLYKTHWWKCNGPCQNRHPFFGLVKRTTNRKPGTYDFWWQEHQLTCGGEFIKIREPSPKRKRATNKENNPGFLTPTKSGKTKPITGSQSNVISNYFNNPNTPASGSAIPKPSVRSVPPKKTYTPGAKPNFGGGTLVVRKPPVTKTSTVTPKPVKPTVTAQSNPSTVPSTSRRSPIRGNLRNVKQFKDLSSDEEGPPKPKPPPIALFTGKGVTLGTSAGPGERRSRLLDKFPASSTNPSKSKKPRIEETPSTSTGSTIETIHLSDDSDYLFDDIDLAEVERTAANIKKERQDAIKKEIIDSFTGEDTDDIVLIDDDYDDELADDELASIDDALLDRSVIDELFNESDELIEDFNRTNAKVKVEKPDDEIVSCPMCLKKMARCKIGDHLEVCYSRLSGESTSAGKSKTHSTATTTNMDMPSTSRGPAATTQPPKKTPASQSKKPPEGESDIITAQQQLLRDCGYTDADISRVLEDSSPNDMPAPDLQTLRQQVLRDCGYTDADIARALDDAVRDDALDADVEIISAVDSCDCPVCGRNIALNAINQHLDQCLSK